MLRELRGRDGEPHGGTRLVALVLVLLLAAPLTYLGLRLAVLVLDHVV